MSTAMMAITTSNSISVKAIRRVWYMAPPAARKKETNDESRSCAIGAST
jgi:hypothetical protein